MSLITTSWIIMMVEKLLKDGYIRIIGDVAFALRQQWYAGFHTQDIRRIVILPTDEERVQLLAILANCHTFMAEAEEMFEDGDDLPNSIERKFFTIYNAMQSRARAL